MWQYVAKILITSVVVVAVAEVGKRSSFWGALIAPLPMTSLLAFFWLYLDTSSTQSVAALSISIFWLVLPSLTLFVVFPLLLKFNVTFWPSLAGACLTTVAAYFGIAWVLSRLPVQL